MVRVGAPLPNGRIASERPVRGEEISVHATNLRELLTSYDGFSVGDAIDMGDCEVTLLGFDAAARRWATYADAVRGAPRGVAGEEAAGLGARGAAWSRRKPKCGPAECGRTGRGAAFALGATTTAVGATGTSIPVTCAVACALALAITASAIAKAMAVASASSTTTSPPALLLRGVAGATIAVRACVCARALFLTRSLPRPVALGLLRSPLSRSTGPVCPSHLPLTCRLKRLSLEN